MPLHYEDSDFDPNIDPRQKRFLTEFAEATGSGNYGYTTWTFYPNDPGVHIWKDMEVVWAGDITPLRLHGRINKNYGIKHVKTMH